MFRPSQPARRIVCSWLSMSPVKRDFDRLGNEQSSKTPQKKVNISSDTAPGKFTAPFKTSQKILNHTNESKPPSYDSFFLFAQRRSTR